MTVFSVFFENICQHTNVTCMINIISLFSMKLLEENPAQFLCYDLEKAIVFPDVLAT